MTYSTATRKNLPRAVRGFAAFLTILDFVKGLVVLYGGSTVLIYLMRFVGVDIPTLNEMLARITSFFLR